MEGTIYSTYFSPTHTTQKVTSHVGRVLAGQTGREMKEIDLTLPQARGTVHSFDSGDVIIFGFPVYGGRIPALMYGVLPDMRGNNTPAVVIATYGNRDYDDALLEMTNALKERGFAVIAAAAFIGEHSFSRKLAAGRPDEKDIELAGAFAQKIAAKLQEGKHGEPAIKGNIPYKDAMPALPFRPKTKDTCTKCMVCVKGCPMGIISADDPTAAGEGCIQCNACVKSCPVHAKYFDDDYLVKAAAMLEANFSARKEPEYFI